MTRAAAFAIDIGIIQVILFGIGIIAGLIAEAFGAVTLDLDVSTVAVAAAGWWIAFLLYFVGFWSLTGQTPGMRALGIKLIRVSGELVRPPRGLLRVLGMILAALPLFAGYLLILVQDQRRGLHDLIAGTVVHYAERDRPPVRPRRGSKRRATQSTRGPEARERART